jgi:hypothetical protein
MPWTAALWARSQLPGEVVGPGPYFGSEQDYDFTLVGIINQSYHEKYSQIHLAYL